MATDDDGFRVAHPTHRHRFRQDRAAGESVSESVIRGVAAVTGDSPEEMRPLYDVVDPDALDQFVASLRGDEHGEVRFGFNGCTVTVHADGVVELRHAE